MRRLLLLSGYLTLSSSLLFGQGSYLNILGLIRGDSLGAQFGKKVVPAGDVNGDGLPDFLVGASAGEPTWSNPPAGAQKVDLFYGKQDALDTVPDLTFGHKAKLEWVGDINGDGQADFAMLESGQKYRLSIYFGDTLLDTIPDGYVKGDSSSAFPGDLYGRHISAGKVCDSGDIQIIVGDPAYNNRGQVYAYGVRNGDIDSVTFWKVLQGAPFQGGGPAIVLGDINSDGYADIASRRGTFDEVNIYFGKPVLDTIPDLILRGSQGFGGNIAAVGDLNSDGFDDFIIGSGRTPRLFFGGNPLDTLPGFTLDRLGDHFVNGGNINADGYDDLLVGQDEYPLTGYAYVYYGGPSMDSIRDLEIHERDLPELAAGFGQTVAGLGGIDGDGSNDFAVGSTSDFQPDQGYLWVFYGLMPSTGVNDERQNVPRNFTLEQNYPNPFNASTTISYSLKKNFRSFGGF